MSCFLGWVVDAMNYSGKTFAYMGLSSELLIAPITVESTGTRHRSFLFSFGLPGCSTEIMFTPEKTLGQS